MEPIFNASTVYTARDYEQYSRYVLYKKAKVNYKITRIIYGIMLVIILAQLYAGYRGNNQIFILTALMLLIPLIAAVVFTSPKRHARKIIKCIPDFNQKPVHTYTFFDNFVRSQSRESSSEIPYDSFTEASESPEYFFLFVGPKECLLLPKRDIQVGRPEELLNFLQQKNADLILS